MKDLQRYLLYSLIIHFLLVFLIPFPRVKDFSSRELTQPVWIDLKKGKYEITDIAPPQIERKPEETRHLGMYDSSVSEETVAQHQGRSQKIKTGKVQNEKDKSEPQKKLEKGIALKKLEEKNPSRDSLLEALPEDFYPDYKKGNHTYLNVMKYPGIHYFVRIKRAVKTTWNPLKSLSEVRFNQRLVAGKLETVLGFSIDSSGNLAEAFIFKDSGIEEFDREALRSLKASSPFASLPQEVRKFTDSDGLLRLNFIFTVYL